MTEGTGHPPGSARARAAFYREKAASLRKRAASSWDVTRATLIQAAQIYEGIAASIEETWKEETLERGDRGKRTTRGNSRRVASFDKFRVIEGLQPFRDAPSARGGRRQVFVAVSVRDMGDKSLGHKSIGAPGRS